MTIDIEPDLIRLGTYAHREDCERVRGFLNSNGIASVLVVDNTQDDAREPESVFDLMVPSVDAARATILMEREEGLEREASTFGPEELPLS